MIDWNVVRHRLQQSEAALERSLSLDDHRFQGVLRQRAAQLAARQRPVADAASIPVLVFTLGEERYALELCDVLQVFPLAHYTPVPGAPPELLGMTNLRGDIRCVLDLGRMLGLQPAADAGCGYAVLIRHAGHEFALRVDEVEKVQRISPSELIRPGADEAAFATQYVKGIGPGGVCLLDVMALFQHPMLSGMEAS